jgi:hypothetical protein
MYSVHLYVKLTQEPAPDSYQQSNLSIHLKGYYDENTTLPIIRRSLRRGFRVL